MSKPKRRIALQPVVCVGDRCERVGSPKSVSKEEKKKKEAEEKGLKALGLYDVVKRIEAREKAKAAKKKAPKKKAVAKKPAAKKCKNCPAKSKKTYKGTEPSPKGLGYCAGCEKVGSVKKGKDGRMWIVSKRKDKRKHWVHKKPVAPAKKAPAKRKAPVKVTAAEIKKYQEDWHEPWMLGMRDNSGGQAAVVKRISAYTGLSPAKAAYIKANYSRLSKRAPAKRKPVPKKKPAPKRKAPAKRKPAPKKKAPAKKRVVRKAPKRKPGPGVPPSWPAGKKALHRKKVDQLKRASNKAVKAEIAKRKAAGKRVTKKDIVNIIAAKDKRLYKATEKKVRSKPAKCSKGRKCGRGCIHKQRKCHQ